MKLENFLEFFFNLIDNPSKLSDTEFAFLAKFLEVHVLLFYYWSIP